MDEAKISVIVPFYNAEKTLPYCLEALLGLNYRNYEIILVDNLSSDNSENIAMSYAQQNKNLIKIVTEKHRGPSFARNKGAQNATGEILAFTDADCIPDEEWLNGLIPCFKNADIGAVAGRVLGHETTTILDKFHSLFTMKGGDTSKVFDEFILVTGGFPTANIAVRKDVFDIVDGFDNSMEIYSEDYDLCARIYQKKYKIKYTPYALVYHKHRNTLMGTWKQSYGFGKGHAVLLRKHFTRLAIIDLPKISYLSRRWPIRMWIDLAGADKKLGLLTCCIFLWKYCIFLAFIYFVYLYKELTKQLYKNKIDSDFIERLVIIFYLLLKSLALTSGRIVGSFRNRVVCL